MTQLDALQLTESLRQRLVDFAADSTFVRDERLAKVAQRLWSGEPEQGGLLSDLWVEGAFPSELSAHSLHDLAQQGRFNADLCRHLDVRGAVPRHRPLFTHQEEAIAAAAQPSPNGSRPALVVTAGTGAGKTEAFLLPILNDLYTRERTGAGGMQCLILYPMNALVNDQVDRLYSWLQDQTRVTLFHFTSETPENHQRANDENVPRWHPCRMRTRSEARGRESHEGQPIAPPTRGRTPDIVITNYSMLEYMLCRPQDTVFFGPALRAIVLDEAHLYTGTLAAEITLLLRRVLARCGVASRDVLHLATSATLGGSNTSELQQFAATLFGKEPAAVHVIEGRASPPQLQTPAPPAEPPTPEHVEDLARFARPLLVADSQGEPILAADVPECRRLRDLLPHVVASSCVAKIGSVEEHPAVVLERGLASSPIAHLLADTLWKRRRLPLGELAATVWGEEREATVRATVALLRLAASARRGPKDYPLVPHRIHLLARPADGLCVCLNRACSAPDAHKLVPLGAVTAGIADRCPACQRATLSLLRCDNCGAWMLGGELERNTLRPVARVTPHTQLFTLESGTGGTALTIDSSTGMRSGVGAAGVTVTCIERCPHCYADREEITTFASSINLSLSIVAETLLAGMPEYPSSANGWLPARGRRLLTFSDSRAEAARLGPRLTHQHEIQLLRAAIVNALGQSLVGDEGTVAMVREWLDMLDRQLSEPRLQPGQRQFLEQQRLQYLAQLQSLSAGGSIADWGSALSKQPELAEVLDPDSSNQHTRDHWGQLDWEGNQRQVQACVTTFLAREFATRLGRTTSAEALGLAEVTYPGLDALQIPPDFLGTLPTDAIRVVLQDCWPAFLAAICDTLRMDNAVTLGNDKEDRSFQLGAVPLGAWAAEHGDWGRLLVRFVGATPRQRRRAFASAVLQRAGMAEGAAAEQAPRLLEAAFLQMFQRAVADGQSAETSQLAWLQRSSRQTRGGPPADAIRLVFTQLGLRRPPHLYRCERTWQIWPRSVLGCAPAPGSIGTLRSLTQDAANADPRLSRQRREYRESPVFKLGLWAEEHSAQLAAKENRRLQDLFKAGIRNILSATTTLELGIDIGGLNGVLMSNVPPGKSNYLQRAGRAGRRADGSSVVVTFARPQPYDREVFRRIGDYLDRPLRRPLVFLDRDRIARRHLHSFLLGEFFRTIYPPDHHVGAMNAFGSLGLFCGTPVPPRWERRDREKPTIAQPPIIQFGGATLPPWWNPALAAVGPQEQFLSYLYWLRDWGSQEHVDTLQTLFAGTSPLPRLDDWRALLEAVIQDFASAIQSWRSEYDALMLSWYVSDRREQANAIRYQLAALSELTVIEGLADRQFLPRYGFPIGVQKLRVIAPDESGRRMREEDQYRLERPGLLALREYVPGSQLLVGGKLITSHGLLKHWTGANIDTYVGLRGFYTHCANDHFYYEIAGAIATCPICGAEPKIAPQQFLFPKHGFSGAAWDPPKWSTATERIGVAKTATLTFAQTPSDDDPGLTVDDFGEVVGLRAGYREGGELLVYNAGEKEKGFAICLACGYAENERTFGQGAMQLTRDFERHAPLHSTRKWDTCRKQGEGPVLRNHTLAARETTDVLMLDFSRCIGQLSSDVKLMTTLAYGLQRAGAEVLGLDAREISVLVSPSGDDGSGWGAVLYDNTPGGSGHVRELLDHSREWLNMTRQVLYVDEAHHTRCQTACLDCLVSYVSQFAEAAELLDRPRALAVLDALLNNGAVPSLSAEIVTVTGPGQTMPSKVTPDQTQRSIDDRLRDAHARRRKKG